MTSFCSICSRAPLDGERTACDGCIDQLRGHLAELPRHLPLLRDALQPERGPAQRGGAGRAHAPLPVDVRVLDLLGPGHVVALEDPHGDQSAGVPMAALLYGWARYLASEHQAVSIDRYGTQQITPCETAWSHRGTGVAAMSAWLIAYLPYAATRPWVDEMHDQVRELVHRVRRITALIPRRTPQRAPCPACQAFALVATDGRWHIRCEACALQLAPAAYAEHAAQVLPPLAAMAVRMAVNRALADKRAKEQPADAA